VRRGPQVPPGFAALQGRAEARVEVGWRVTATNNEGHASDGWKFAAWSGHFSKVAAAANASFWPPPGLW